MRISNLLIGLQLGAMMIFSLRAQTLTTNARLAVDSHMDIYRAGGYDDSSDGEAPAEYRLGAGGERMMIFSSVTGTWTCGATEGAPYYGPDGTIAISGHPCGPISIQTNGPLSGYYATDFQGALVGVFLKDDLPSEARPSRVFYVADSSIGGVQTNFAVLTPLIGQVFFIGDGLTGTGTGQPQIFLIPAFATRLYLGYVDGCAVGVNAHPGCFWDNGGEVMTEFGIFNIK